MFLNHILKLIVYKEYMQTIQKVELQLIMHVMYLLL